MIPGIDEILDGVLDGTYTRDQSRVWLHRHTRLSELREHFAAMAMQGIITRGVLTQPIEIAQQSVSMADALVKEFSK